MKKKKGKKKKKTQIREMVDRLEGKRHKEKKVDHTQKIAYRKIDAEINKKVLYKIKKRK